MSTQIISLYPKTVVFRDLSKYSNINIKPSDKSGEVVIIDFTHDNNKIIELLNKQTKKNKNKKQKKNLVRRNFSAKPSIKIQTFSISLIKKLITKENKFWSSLIDYYSTIPRIYGLPKTDKQGIPQ